MNFTFDLTITLSLVVTIVLAFIGWVRMRNAAVDKRFEVCDDRLGRHEQRIQAAEQSLQQIPSRDDLHNLALSISEMRGDVREMRASMQGQGAIMARLGEVVSRQEEHLMRGSK